MTADPVPTREVRIADLEREVLAIDQHNKTYWAAGSAADTAARGEYQRRLDRLEDIRRELAQLLSVE
jgi:hypothetical protein